MPSEHVIWSPKTVLIVVWSLIGTAAIENWQLAMMLSAHPVTL